LHECVAKVVLALHAFRRRLYIGLRKVRGCSNVT
jgi:hypothetical protein